MTAAQGSQPVARVPRDAWRIMPAIARFLSLRGGGSVAGRTAWLAAAYLVLTGGLLAALLLQMTQMIGFMT